MAREPRMPRGMSRCGFLVSSAVVATMSNPMNAKNTIEAPAMTPARPYTAGSMPSRVLIKVASMKPPPESGVGSEGGMNGE